MDNLVYLFIMNQILEHIFVEVNLILQTKGFINHDALVPVRGLKRNNAMKHIGINNRRVSRENIHMLNAYHNSGAPFQYLNDFKFLMPMHRKTNTLSVTVGYIDTGKIWVLDEIDLMKIVTQGI
jgi:hypothetical protein